MRGICDIDKLCEIAKKFNSIVIPAHLHSTKDAFKSRSIDDIYTDGEFLRACKQFTAIEVTSEATAGYFDGNHAETANMQKTCIWSSDSHQPDEIARRFCYVEMEQPNFLELKAGLELSDRTSLNPPSQAEEYIIGLHVRGQFLRDFWLTLSPHCNAFIGVKGAGKTSVLECLRFALGAQVPESEKGGRSTTFAKYPWRWWPSAGADQAKRRSKSFS